MAPFIEPDDTRYDERSRALVAVGREAIAQENPEALRAYFSPDFQFHGPDGDLDFAGLEAFFSQMRSAFNGYYCERHEIVSVGELIGCRTEMGGTFTAPFEASPFGTVSPTGEQVTLSLINMFRYDAEGKLAEEWVAYDNVEWMRQLGVPLAPTRL
ncbi:ester cyclase [Actinoalloteichus spitiensis]|uniref:ester cyclase n=1 Tax=Actinoalloteichus spitiensis TaxID=252394 RepID=UPI0002DAFE66|nr:ester cyclase [Actinoalloteichus spitiensis]